ncbi:Os02g0745200 [Oryza sativa Japonica Group]|uniref:Os02g0745200 protein n=1 Tax=Oryza sativa subsp. japonica TaxID=39947 RepID=A0A0P0VPG3_ORYSJ|nr:hypothetical protein EE612_013660 [Oryza sativa]BAS80899.1 Os02g0745200 [Oryza sativa Japonica Group]
MHDSENGCGAIGGMLGFTGMIVVLYSHLSQVGSARRMSSPPLIVWKCGHRCLLFHICSWVALASSDNSSQC